MNKNCGLSDTEYEIMKLFWRSEAPLAFAEVLKYCNTELGLNWAQTTLHTYLTRLIQKGVLMSERKGYRRSYFAKVSEQELSHLYINEIVSDVFDGSIKNLLLSLTYQSSLTQAEADELKALLDASVSEENV